MSYQEEAQKNKANGQNNQKQNKKGKQAPPPPQDDVEDDEDDGMGIAFEFANRYYPPVSSSTHAVGDAFHVFFLACSRLLCLFFLLRAWLLCLRSFTVPIHLLGQTKPPTFTRGLMVLS